MDILSNLQGLLGAAGGAPAGRSSGGGAGDALGALGGLLTPDMLGGLASAFLGGRSGGGGMGGGGAGAIGGLLTSLLAGGGGAGGGLLTSLLSGGGGGAGAGGGAGGLMGGLLGSLMGGEGGGGMGGGFGGGAPAPSSQSDRTRRVILALVFAARADGHVDANEEAAINDKIRSLGIGREGMQLVDQAMSAPLDPNLIAQGLSDPSEAMTLYALSFALTDADQFMERSYLDGLATALRIPQQAKGQIEMKMRGR